MSILNLQNYTRESLDSYLNIASNYFKHSFYYDELCFDLRGGSAGQFVAIRQPINKLHLKLRFNNALLEKYHKAFVDEVVPHECAHLVVFQLYGTKHKGQRVLPHGAQWKQVMREVFARPPVVRHKFEVERKTKKSFLYLCACSGRSHDLTIIRHNKILNNKAHYLCKVCKTRLVFAKGR